MRTYVSLDKRSKKAQKEFYAAQRITWNGMNPATRSVPNGKAYNRNKAKQEKRKIGMDFSDGIHADFFYVMVAF